MICVSRVLRSTRAMRGMVMAERVESYRSAASSASFSAGVPTVMRRQLREQRMLAVQVLHQDTGSPQRREPARRVRNARQHEIRLRRGTSPRRAAPPAPRSSRERSAREHRRLLREQRALGEQHRRHRLRQRVEIIRLPHLVQFGHPFGRRDRVTRAAGPPCRSSRRVRSTSRFGNSATRGRKLASANA